MECGHGLQEPYLVDTGNLESESASIVTGAVHVVSEHEN